MGVRRVGGQVDRSRNRTTPMPSLAVIDPEETVPTDQIVVSDASVTLYASEAVAKFCHDTP